MTKREKVYMGVAILSMIAVIGGVITYFIIFGKENNVKPQMQIAEEKVVDDCVLEGENWDKTEEANSAEEKVSPNASLVLQKKYKACGHTVKEFVELPTELINNTEEEIKGKYKEFVIEKFGAMEVILSKEVEGNCGEHYLLKEKENQIAIYQIDEEGEENFLQDTGIATDYLPETDRIAIQNGIKVYGKEALNSSLEDYE